MPKKINVYDEIGKKYSRLTITGNAGRDSKNRPMVNAVCDCGKSIIADLIYMRFGDKKSCGCLSEEIFKSVIKKSFYGFTSAVEAAKFRDKKCVELGLITTMNFPREEVASWL